MALWRVSAVAKPLAQDDETITGVALDNLGEVAGHFYY